MKRETDFSQGSVAGNILRMAGPMILAQLVNVLYSIVDRMYIGHIPGASANALTGVGVTFPILLMISAFANLFGTGGVSLFSIARGQGDVQHAQRLMGNACAMLLLSCVCISAAAGLFMRPLLYAFGASDATYPYAQAYLSVYLLGTAFVMLGLGMNGFINAQGFALRGMGTVVLGAAINIVLDPICIFVLDMGVRGAAWATVIAQVASALWAMCFLTSPDSPDAARDADSLAAGGRHRQAGLFRFHHGIYQQRSTDGVQLDPAGLRWRSVCGRDDGDQLRARGGECTAERLYQRGAAGDGL